MQVRRFQTCEAFNQVNRELSLINIVLNFWCSLISMQECCEAFNQVNRELSFINIVLNFGVL